MLFYFGQQSNVSFSLFGTGGTTNANANGVAIDTKGYSGIGVALIGGLKGDATGAINVGNALTLAFREGDDTNVQNATRLSAANLIKSENLTDTNSVAYFSIRPTKRYVFPEVYKTNATSITSNVNVSVVGVLGFPNEAPTT